MNKAELAQRIRDLGAVQEWNHNIQLPHGLETRPQAQISHGKNLVKWKRIEPLLGEFGVAGKRILDIGCNEGFFSLQAAEMGGLVTGVDIDPQRIEKAKFVKEAIGAANVDFRVLDVYSHDFDQFTPFDLSICMGFIHRIPDPVLALKRLSEKSEAILLEWKCLKMGPHDEPFAYFTPPAGKDTPPHETQYWLMSIACVKAILESCGYSYFRAIDDSSFRRAILIAGRNPSAVFDKPDDVVSPGRMRILARHSKRYLSTVAKILAGRLNA